MADGECHVCLFPESIMRVSAQGMKLNLSKEEQILGITVSRNYKFYSHISNVVSNVNYKLSHVAMLKSGISFLTDAQEGHRSSGP